MLAGFNARNYTEKFRILQSILRSIGQEEKGLGKYLRKLQNIEMIAEITLQMNSITHKIWRV